MKVLPVFPVYRIYPFNSQRKTYEEERNILYNQRQDRHDQRQTKQPGGHRRVDSWA